MKAELAVQMFIDLVVKMVASSLTEAIQHLNHTNIY